MKDSSVDDELGFLLPFGSMLARCCSLFGRNLLILHWYFVSSFELLE